MMWSMLYLIRNNPEKIKWSQRRRGLDEKIVDRAVELDRKWRKILTELNELRRKHNIISREVAKLTGAERQRKIEEAKKLLEEIEVKEKLLREVEDKRNRALLSIPNIVHESVPVGEDEDDNVPIRFYGKPKVWEGYLDRFREQVRGFNVDYEVINWKPIGHADMLEVLGLGNTLKAGEVAGSRFYYLFDDLVWLDMALLMYALDYMTKQGFTVVLPPYMMRRKPYEAVTTLSDFEDAIYKVEGEDLYLIATSEHPIAALHMNEIIRAEDLPLLYTGISPCFRKEAGAHGKDTKGIFRVHQFHKVEQFVFCLPEDSWSWIEKLIRNAEELWQGLGIPYRIVNICTGELSAVVAKRYDLEAWMPAQGKYREMVSCSNCTDWQSYRLKIRFQRKIEKGFERGYVHTLNSTAIASTRAITAILENYQEPDGTVIIPKVLRPYLEMFKKAPKEAIYPRKKVKAGSS
ncbi:MAG: serine--tRNA ligase [Thaumarchaeota archaeon]|nr:MAG: serine--tRNA ligase [Nitrososphaerota archaeon]